MNFYGKPFISIGGFKSRMWYHFSISISFDREMHDKLYGYHSWYYDGTFHYFSIYPVKFHWLKRPDMKYIGKHNKCV